MYTKDNSETVFINQKDNTPNPGYSDKWQQSGPCQEVKGTLKVKDIQTSLEGGKVSVAVAIDKNNAAKM